MPGGCWGQGQLFPVDVVPDALIGSVFFSHADIPDTCVHYVGGFLDALIQGPKEVRALVQAWQAMARLERTFPTAASLHLLCPAGGALVLQ